MSYFDTRAETIDFKIEESVLNRLLWFDKWSALMLLIKFSKSFHTAVTWPSFQPNGFVTQWKLCCQIHYLMAVSNVNQNFCFCFVCYSNTNLIFGSHWDSCLSFPATKTTDFSGNSINCYDFRDFDDYLIYLPAETTLWKEWGKSFAAKAERDELIKMLKSREKSFFVVSAFGEAVGKLSPAKLAAT